MAEYNRNTKDPEDIYQENVDGIIDDILAQQMTCVKLKQGLEMSDLAADDGIVFEIDEDDLRDKNVEEDEQLFDENIHKCLKYELLGESSSEEDEKEIKIVKDPFEKLATLMVDITENSTGGILKRVMKTGEGKIVPQNALVTIHYNGYLEFNSEPFDSTIYRRRKSRLKLNSGSLIPGLDQGIQSMRKKEKALFLIKPEYAFGLMGCPPRIPPNATVLFQVELCDFTDDEIFIELNDSSSKEDPKTLISKILKICQTDQQAGNQMFHNKEFKKACSRYHHGIKLLQIINFPNDKGGGEVIREMKTKFLLNLSLVNDKLGNPKESHRYAKMALNLDRHNIKALFRVGHALLLMGELNRANDYLLRAKQKAPSNPDIERELNNLLKRKIEAKNAEKAMCMKMFNQNSNSSQSASHLPLSQGFKEFVREQIVEFKEDKMRTEMVFPEGLTPEEYKFISSVSKELKLVLQTTKYEDEMKVIKIFKN